jgi:hypothetical protein
MFYSSLDCFFLVLFLLLLLTSVVSIFMNIRSKRVAFLFYFLDSICASFGHLPFHTRPKSDRLEYSIYQLKVTTLGEQTAVSKTWLDLCIYPDRAIVQQNVV